MARPSDDQHFVLCHRNAGKQLYCCAGRTGMLTFTRSSDILGTIRTLFLLRLSRTGASILRSCVLSKIGRLGGTSDVLLAETSGPCGCWSCGSLVRTFLLPSLRDAYGGLFPVAYSRFFRHLPRCASTNGPPSPPQPGNLGQFIVPSFPLRTPVNTRAKMSKRSFRALLRSEPS